MKKLLTFTMLVATGMCLTGCASKKDLVACQNNYNTLMGQFQQTQEQLSETKQKLSASEARVTGLQEQLSTNKRAMSKMEESNKALQSSLNQSLTNASQNNVSIEKLVDQINESNQYIRHLVEVKSKSDSLNMVLTNNLTRSLSK